MPQKVQRVLRPVSVSLSRRHVAPCGFACILYPQVTAQISERTGHLPGVAIAIMGCIVNGVGEMADADFGYVGGAPGKVRNARSARVHSHEEKLRGDNFTQM